MFKYPLRLFQSAAASSKILQNARFFASFRNREFMFETSDAENFNSLISQFARHVVIKEAKNEDLVKYNIRYADYFPVSDIRHFIAGLKKISNDELPRMVVFTSIYRSRSEIPIFVQVINYLDDECSVRIDSLNHRQIIEILNAFMYMIPNKIAQLDFYRLAMHRLVDLFEQNSSADNFVKTAFYLGMWKKNGSNLLDQFLKSYFTDYISDLSTMDFAIVANAAFKASVRVNLDSFRDRLVKEIVENGDDLSLFITFLKSCRHNKIKSDVIVDKIREAVANNGFEHADIRAIAHIFSYLAENLINDDDIVTFFVEKGTEMINNSTRDKDIASFLWSCAYLGLELSQETLQMVDKVLHKKVFASNTEFNVDDLVDCCLSLLMLGHKTQLIHEIGSAPHRKGPNRVKLDSRRILLSTLVKSEQGHFKPKGKNAPNYLITPNMKKVQEELGANAILPIEELNIPSIFKNDTYYEVLDPSNVTSKGTPHGFMKLKLKLLQNWNCNVKIINTLTEDWESQILSQEVQEQKN